MLGNLINPKLSLLGQLCIFNLISSVIAIQSKIVPGVYIKEFQPAANKFYQSFLPLVYEFQVPSWTSENLYIPGSQSCINSSYGTSTTTCPVTFHLATAQKIFSSYLVNAEPLIMNFDYDSLEGSISPIESTMDFDCYSLSPHFHSIFTDKATTRKYIEKLRSCSKNALFIENIPSYKYNISQPYLDMRRGFFNEYWLKIHDGSGLWSNAINVLNTMSFTNYLMESNRWRYAVNDCSMNKRIPQTLVPSALLIDSLKDLEKSAAKDNYKTVISLSSLIDYYTTPLTDCTFTNDTLLVRILIPVISTVMNYNLVQLNSAPFMYQAKDSFFCEISNSGSTYKLVDNSRRLVFDTNCQPSELCQIPNILNMPQVNLCATSLVFSDLKGVKNNCDMKCTPSSSYANGIEGTLLIRKVTENTYVLSGQNLSQAFISCPNQPHLLLRDLAIGAVEIKIPCNCRININNGIITPDYCEQPGNIMTKVFHIAPIHWTNDKRVEALIARPNDAQFRIEGLILPKNLQNNLPQSQAYGSENSNQINGTSGTVKFFLGLCFVLIICLIGALLFVLMRIKSMGGLESAFDYTRQNSGVSYRAADPPLLHEDENGRY